MGRNRTFVATPATIGQVLQEAREATPPTEEERAARADRWRALPHLSQAEHGARCGLHQPRIAKVESGGVVLRLDDLEHLAKGLGLRVEIRLVRD